MKTENIIALLTPEIKKRFDRVRNWFEPIPENGNDFLSILRKAEGYASIADGRAGYIGNPYEQTLADILRIQTEVKVILESGR